MRIPLLFFGVLFIGILAAALPNIAQANYSAGPTTCPSDQTSYYFCSSNTSDYNSTDLCGTSGAPTGQPASYTSCAYGCRVSVGDFDTSPVCNPPPTPTASLSANPSSITSGNSSTLTWSSTNAASCSATWTTSTATSGSQGVSPTSTTEYSISCSGATASATVTVSAAPPPPPPPPSGDTTNPVISISSVPILWQNSDAAITIGCSDTNNCETSTNWKWYTSATSISSCSTNVSNYTNSYDGVSIPVSSHVWLCASAQDTNNNRGFSAAVEIKVDKTKPVSRITSPPIPAEGESWQASPSFTVSVSDTDTGGSGLVSCGFAIYNNGGVPAQRVGTFTPCSGGSADFVFSVYVNSGLRDCTAPGSRTCAIVVSSQDVAGNTSEFVQNAYSIDYTVPVMGAISPTSAAATQEVTLQASVSDEVSDIASCSLFVDGTNEGAMSVSGGVASKSYVFPASGTFLAHASCNDLAGNTAQGTDVSVAASIPPLSYPSAYWQRLWYTTSGSSPNVSLNTFLGEGSGSNDRNGNPPNVTSAIFYTDWSSGQLYNIIDSITFNGTDNIGFKSSRTIDFASSPGNYRFTVGSDDGIKLYIDGTLQINQWSDGSYRTAFVDINMTTAPHTFLLEYYENGSTATVSFNYAPAPCAKTTAPFPDPPDSFNISVSTSTGTKQCAVSILEKGSDNTDNSSVSFESLSHPAQANYIGMDDNPSPGCQNDLKFHTSWNLLTPSQSSPYNFFTGSRVDAYNAGNALGYGFQLSSGDTCVFQGAVGECSGGGNYCPTVSPSPATVNGSRALTVVGQKSGLTDSNTNYAGLENRQTTDYFGFNFNVVECTADAQCQVGGNSDANSNTAKCNTGTTANFPLNTCIDSVAPTSKIKNLDDTQGNLPGFARNVPRGGAYSAFFKAGSPGGGERKIWWFDVEDKDNGIDCTDDTCTCYITINGDTRQAPRRCNGLVSFTVGKDNPLTPYQDADCVNEGRDTCEIKVWAKDLAGNRNDATALEREIGIKQVVPSLVIPFDQDERKYNRFDIYSNGFNIWKLGVDWTPPVAQ